MIKIISANVNGIRAAARKGGLDELARLKPDVLCLQEVRANREQLDEALAGSKFADWNIYLADAEAKGRAGVAILSKLPVSNLKTSVGPAQFKNSGRWIQGDIDFGAGASTGGATGGSAGRPAGGSACGTLTVASAYVPTGDVGTPKQDEKYAFLEAMTKRMRSLNKSAAAGGNQAIVMGDINIGHTELDIKNWRGNLKNSGFLPEERAYLSKWLKADWVDLGREFAGEVDGPYTWWSMRGQAFDNDTGWRIDCLYATPELAANLKDLKVARAKSYAERWSDHAPLVASF